MTTTCCVKDSTMCFFCVHGLRTNLIHLQLGGDSGAQVLSEQPVQEGNLSLKLRSFVTCFCLKTSSSVVLNLQKEISRSQDLYFRSTNYIFPIVINRKFVLNAKGYWFYQTGRLDLLILSLRYIHLPVEIKSVLVWKLLTHLKRLWLYFHPHPIQNVGFKRIILKLCLLCTEFPNS